MRARYPTRHATNSFLRVLASRIVQPSPLVTHLCGKESLNRDDRKTLITALANVGITHYTK
jgi:hypothetical protein